MPEARRILLDTHALIWWANGSRALSAKVRRLMADEMTVVLVSAATAWEITTKVRLRRLMWPVEAPVGTYCAGQRFRPLPVSFAHAERAGSWPTDHGDPFDRMLAAQSHIERVPIATNDPMMAAFGIETVW
jgi:PIN domain nuclease of toxin-antitoxin system